ncbi:MAG: nucleotide exchange factor GrpE, partial [Maritimibacter sp.]
MADAKKKDDLSDIEAAIDEIMAGAAPEAEVEEAEGSIDAAVEAVIAERDEYKDKFMRALADA